MPETRALRVLHVIPSVAPQRGGPSFVIRAIARGLTEQGVVVDVVTTNDNGTGVHDVELYRPLVEDGASYRYFPRQTRFYACSWPLAAWLWKHVRDYDLVHVHALFSFSSTVAAIVARMRGVPYIVRPLGILNRWGMKNRRPFLKRLSFNACEKQILRNANAVQFTTELERLEAADLGACRPAVIPNPVEWQEVVPHMRSAGGSPVFLFLSRIDEKKGLDLLLESFSIVRREMPASRLVIAGEGPPPLVASLHALAERHGIQDSVTWAGFVEGESKKRVLAEADIFVLSSYSENFGVSVVEAMAAGLPVVITDQVGIHPEITRAKAGMVARCNAQDFADAMLAVGRNPGSWQAMCSSGRVVANEKFSVAAVSHSLIELYLSVRAVAGT
ncbi:MAG: glycosyltransferase [Terriglobia bacterium]